MQILYTPMWSKTTLNSDSNYVLLANFARQLLKQRPESHLFVPWPDSNSGFKYDCDGLFKQSNITRIPMPYYAGRHFEVMSFYPMHWKKLTEKLAYTMHWANDIEKIAAYKTLTVKADQTSAVPIIGHHHYMIHPSTGYSFEKDLGVLSRQLMGSRLSTRTIFNSEHCRGMFLEMAEKFLSKESTEHILNHSNIVHLGVTEDNEQTGTPNPDIFTVVYNHRLQAYKNYTDTFDILNELYEEGLRFKVVVTNTSNGNANRVKAYPFVEFKLCPTRQDYHNVLKSAHLNITNSQHETFCISAVESMMYGQVLLAPNAVTFPEITGAKTIKYPYLFNSKDEQKKMFRHLYNNRDEITKWGGILKKYVNSNFSQYIWAKQHIDIMENIYDSIPPVWTNDKAMSALLKTGEENVNQPFSIVLRKLRRQNYFGQQSWSVFRMTKCLQENGFVVKTQNGQQFLRRQ